MPRAHGMEEYLEAIYVLETEGEQVLSSRIADYLNVSRPTVTQTMQRMQASGYVEVTEHKDILLTVEGRQKAEAVVRRHRLLERWLTDELGLDWAEAHVEAARLEHAVSPLVEDRLFEKLGHPTTCPHGNVIPGSGFQQPKGRPLSEMNQPCQVEVVRIVELAEEDLELLRFFHRSGLIPGATIDVTEKQSPYEAGIPIIVEATSARLSLQKEVAGRVLVIDRKVIT